MIEPILQDHDKVQWNVCYIVDGEMMPSPMTGSVAELKRRLDVSEVRHCDVYARLRQAEHDLAEAQRTFLEIQNTHASENVDRGRSTDFSAFVAVIVADGMLEAHKDYSHPRDGCKLAGALQGLSDCLRVRSASELEQLWKSATDGIVSLRLQRQERRPSDHLLGLMSRHQEIEWVVAVVSARQLQDHMTPIVMEPPRRQVAAYEAKIRQRERAA